MGAAFPLPQIRSRANTKRPGRQRPRLRWFIIPLIVILIAGGAYYWWLRSRQTTTATFTTGRVTQGDISTTVSGSGAIAAARTVDLTLEQGGTLTSVDVKVGDQVKTGQTIAQINPTDLQLALQQAQANLKSAEASMKQAQGGSATPEDLKSAQASLDSAEASLQQTKTGTATAADIKSAQANLQSAQAKLDAVKNPTQANLSAAQTTLDQAQTTLQTQTNSLSAAKTSAYNSMQQAVNSLTQAQTNYAKAKSDWDYVQATGANPSSPTTTNSDGDSVKNKLSDSARQEYYNSYVQSEASMHSSETALQQAQLNYETAQKAEATQIPQLQQAVANAQTQYDAVKTPDANDVKQAQLAVVSAQASLDKLRQGGTAAAIAQSEASVVQAQANLDSLTAPKTEADIAAADANVLQAQVAVSTAQTNLDQATLKAPFDGVISAVNVVGGSTVSASTAAVTLVDTSTLHVAVSLSEADAAKVQATQPVSLTFDALPDVTLKGTVANVAPTSTTSQNVVTYAVDVTFDPGKNPVKVGMSATAEIEVSKITGALLVPSRAVTTSGTNKTVTVLRGATTQATAQTSATQAATPVSGSATGGTANGTGTRRANGQQFAGGQRITIPVKTGLTSNGETQITSSGGDGVPALQAGDVVVIPSTTASGTTTTTTRTNNRGILSTGTGPGAGAPPGP